jgi:cell division protease FtsH
MAEDEIRGSIATLLGGRSAEEVVFGKVSTGASDDIQKATDLAERMVTLYGMNARFGPVAFEKTQQQFLTPWQNSRRGISPDLTAEIDEEIQLIIDAAHQIAQNILLKNRELLEMMAQQLLQQEVLEGEQLHEFLAQVKPPMELNQWLLPQQFMKNGHVNLISAVLNAD